jgi:uncharacterized protein (TIGR02678 family)
VSDDHLAILDTLERRELEERQAAVRALLRHPLLTTTQPDPRAFRLVRRHAVWLREWFAENAGWALRVDNGLARLQKRVPHAADATRPARAERGGAAFSRRRYALVCLGLAVLERAEGQVTLGYLADHVVELVAEPAVARTGLAFAIASRDERADLVAVVRLLQRIGVVARVAGDEQDFVSRVGDALYDVDRRALAGTLATPRGASLVDAPDFEGRLAALEDEPLPDVPEAHRRAIRQALVRRLLDDPVVYLEDLTDEQQSYLISQRPFLLRRVCEATGWLAEVRAEGIALLDPSGDATDARMPEEGTDGHATLLVAEYLAERLKQRGPQPVPVAELRARMGAWAHEHRSHWRKGASEPSAELELCALAIHRLAGLGLIDIQLCGAQALPLPAIARFHYQPAVVQSELDAEVA